MQQDRTGQNCPVAGYSPAAFPSTLVSGLEGGASVAEPDLSGNAEPVEVVPVVVLSKTFPARPSSIPEIREFVRHSLADSPLTEAHNREVSQTVFRALLDAAGPTGTIQVSFRIFPDQVEVDVLHSHSGQPGEPTLAQLRDLARSAGQPQPAAAAAAAATDAAVPATDPPAPDPATFAPATFAQWMSAVMRREGLTQEATARQLGVSVKTVRRWVGGETEPRMRDLRRIQERFGDVPLP